MLRASQLNPNNAEVQQFLSFLYILAGERKMARKHLDLALAINPLSEETQFFNAYFHYMVEDYEVSLKLLDKCLSVNDKNIPAHSVKTICLLMLGEYDNVINYYNYLPSEVIVQGEKIGTIGIAYALQNEAIKTVEYLAQLKEQAKDPDGFAADSYLFMMYANTGDIDNAFKWVANAIETKSPLLALRYADPLVSAIKSDPRYKQFHKIIFKTEAATKKVSQKKVLLNAQDTISFTSRLLAYIKEKEPFLDPGLSLRILAKQIQMHPNQLSWLLNESIGKNFNEFINHYRIETFKLIAKDPKNTNLTIEGLAYDSGFNSKTVFNTYFKKETGLTPKQFLKQ